MATGAANHIVQVQRPPAGARKVGVYKNAAGYLRTRWQTGPRRYAEMYQHRQVARPAAGQDVDHKNRDKADNSRGNLQALSRRRHNQVQALRKKLGG
jgi:HNH endonuclease